MIYKSNDIIPMIDIIPYSDKVRNKYEEGCVLQRMTLILLFWKVEIDFRK